MARKHTNDNRGLSALYVSPKGNDRWTGTLPDPNVGRTDGPLATLAAAKRAIRVLRRKRLIAGPVTVWLREGTYFVKRPLIFTAADSGIPEKKKAHRPGYRPPVPVTFAAYKNERALVSGGKVVTGWKEGEINGRSCWIAKLPAVKAGRWSFRQLWVNGERRRRPRLPRQGFFRVEQVLDNCDSCAWNNGQTRFRYTNGDIDADWTNLNDIEIHVFNFWLDPCVRIDRVDPVRRIVYLDRNSLCSLIDVDKRTKQGAQYVTENVFEALTEPGQWYLDRPNGILYYIPQAGETIGLTQIVAPVAEGILRLEGNDSERRPVQYIRFRNIRLAHCEWSVPDGWTASLQAAHEVPGAINVRHARNISFEGCQVAHVGGYGIHCESACDVSVVRCELRDLGAGGIKIWHGCRRMAVTDNEIGDGGHVFAAGVGALVGKAIGTRVLHNHIHDFHYTGISVGWTWGYAESDAYGNIVEHNHVHDLGKGMLSDMGGIYCLGVQPGTRLRGNVIHGICTRIGTAGWGIYADEGASDILIENNLVYDTGSGAAFHQHYGRENIIQNNIFVCAAADLCSASASEPHCAFTFRRNICLVDKGVFWSGQWNKALSVMARNLYWDLSGGSPRKKLFCGMTFAQWQKTHIDAGSIVADPRFVAAGKLDFRLKNDSPARKIGFATFELSMVGPRNGATWSANPRVGRSEIARVIPGT